MSDAYIIEIDDIAAGIVQRERGGFRFRAADPRFYRLENRLYTTPWRAQRAAEDIVHSLSARRRKAAAAPAAEARGALAAAPGWGLAPQRRPPSAHLDMPR
ncbi:hypothetical protein [Vineibacter terrae]|uniref:hypothetical protein n=1 Tax=Vineibacter terrae TaxID=2586908 RepID=UPI002E346FBC|nr:hypothetical protein [Vineibacter terrae]HEX2888839.1 hypothetical protein [Vineibacter terrae]